MHELAQVPWFFFVFDSKKSRRHYNIIREEKFNLLSAVVFFDDQRNCIMHCLLNALNSQLADRHPNQDLN